MTHMRDDVLRIVSLICLLLVSSDALVGQNTVGVISYDINESYDGYNLFFPHNQSTVFLTNNCGEIINSWTDEDVWRPGNSVYLLESGDLVKCKRFFNSTGDSIWAGGGGQIVEVLDWDNNVVHSFELNNEQARLHHDVAIMPNGHILMIAWELRTLEECLQAGRSPETLTQNKLWPDYILEWSPSTDSVVWEWHAWDHLIQDFDASSDNFGVVADHPELIDVNASPRDGFPDWMHTNGIDYHPDLDQILLSVPFFDEVWIIDHSTTTEEAAGHDGGTYGKGGDLLFRWGNPATYQRDGDQTLFFQHDAHWADDFLSSDDTYYNSIVLFNNRVGEDYSTVNVLTPTTAPGEPGMYTLGDDGLYGPTEFDLTVTHPDTFSLYSNSLSGAQLLPNGNFLICSGRWGRMFEITPDSENVVWEYRVPLIRGSPIDQGTVLEFNNNITFRLNRYPKEFGAFDNRDLSPKGYIETNPDVFYCDLITPTIDLTFEDDALHAFPNPVDDEVFIDLGSNTRSVVTLYNNTGQLMLKADINSSGSIDVSQLNNGVYYLSAGGYDLTKIIIHR